MTFKVLLLILLSVFLLIPCVLYDVYRGLAYIVVSLAFSATSLLTYYRRLEFLVAESVHSSLLAVTAGYIIEYYIGGNIYYYALPIGLLLVYVTMALVKKGFMQEKAIAITSSLTLVLTILLVHYALTRIPMKYSLSSLLLGDPLLVSTSEAMFAIILSLIVTFIIVLVFRRVLEVSVDEVSALLAGINVSFYDFFSYTLIGVVSITLLKFAGYIAEHVMLLLPASIAALYSNNMREHVWLGLVVGFFSATSGLMLSILLGGAPTGFTGLVLILLLLLKHIVKV